MRWFVLVLLIGATACGAAGHPTSFDSAAPQAGLTQPAPGSATASGSANAVAHQDWNTTIAAAKQEGKLAILGQPGTDAQEGLTKDFHQRYLEIAVEYNGGTSADKSSKIFRERDAGLYSTDIYIDGTFPFFATLIPGGIIDPIAPYLVGPSSAETSAWLGGKFEYSDEEGKYNLIYTSAAKSILAYDPAQLQPADLKSYKQLLDPKWKGKIAMLDPRAQGAGLGIATFFYNSSTLGQDFLRQLLTSGIAFTRDDRQLLDWVSHGQYAIALAPSEQIGAELQHKGVPVNLLDPHGVQEGTYLTAAGGTVGVVNKAPHPNAARVYLDWLLSKEGQTDWSRASGYPSRRLDVPRDHIVFSSTIPREGFSYADNYRAASMRVQADADKFVKSVLPG